MSRNQFDKTATPVYRAVVARVFRALSRLKSGVAKSIDAHHERAASLRAYQGERLDGASASNPKGQSARVRGD